MTGVSRALSALRELPGVRRAWPASDGSLTVEVVRDASLLAGRLSADGGLRLAGHRRDPRLPGLTPSGGRLVVHRLHRRAVVLHPDRATKVLRPGRAAGVAAVSSQMGEACRRAGLGAAAVRAVAEDRLEFELLPGRTLHELGDDGLDGWRELAARWPLLARQPVNVPAHDAAAEVAVLRQWLGHAELFGSLPRMAELARAVDRTCGGLADAPDPAVTLHRDLHDKQALWDGDSLARLDLDTAARGEAALDLANLLTHVDLRHAQGSLREPGPVREALAGVVEELRISPERLATYGAAARLRLAFVYSFRPSAGRWLDAWVDRTLTHAPLSG